MNDDSTLRAGRRPRDPRATDPRDGKPLDPVRPTGREIPGDDDPTVPNYRRPAAPPDRRRS